MSTFSLKIISTDKVFYDGKCEYLVIPTIDGEKGILAHHENMVIAVEIGELRFRKHLCGKAFFTLMFLKKDRQDSKKRNY